MKKILWVRPFEGIGLLTYAGHEGREGLSELVAVA